MNNSASTNGQSIVRVLSGRDRFDEKRGLGISSIDFKLSLSDNKDVFIIENTFHAKGGPARHLHFAQDEWFFALEGEFSFEIGHEKIRLQPGDSVLGPRMVPHVWAHTGESTGKILIVFLPAGKMEAFFREVTKSNAMPAMNPDLWRAYGMELLGPPLLAG